MMRHLHEEHQRLKIKIPGLRFPTYRKVVVPNEEEWKRSTIEVVRLCLEASFRSERPTSKKERAKFYEQTRKMIQKEIPNGGLLVTNHLMAILAIVGLVPLWFAEEHTVETTSKSIMFLVKHKGLVKGKPAAQCFLDSLSGALLSIHGIAASRKYTENVCCKAYRIETDGWKSGKNSSNERFLIWYTIHSVSSKWMGLKFTFPGRISNRWR